MFSSGQGQQLRSSQFANGVDPSVLRLKTFENFQLTSSEKQQSWKQNFGDFTLGNLELS